MKYYKIVNQNGHHGVIYKEGINIDPVPFNPQGDCEPGGMYFSREDILEFVIFGSEIWEVEPVGDIYENPGKPKKWKAHSLKMKRLGEWMDINIFRQVVEDGANIFTDNNDALHLASKSGHTDIVEYIYEVYTETRC